MAQFFGGNLAGPTEMTEMLSSGLDTAEKARLLEQKRKYEQAFQSNLDEKGNLNEKGFYQAGIAAGLNPDQLREAARYHLEQTKTGTELANNQALQRIQGYDPNAGGRNQAGYGAPEPLPSTTVGGGSGVVNENTVNADNLRSPSEVGKTTGVPTTATTIKTGEASVAPSGAPASTASKPLTVAELKQYFASKRGQAEGNVQGLQSALGVTPDGKVGPKTAGALNKDTDLLAELRRRIEGKGADTAPQEPTAEVQNDGSITGQASVTAAPAQWKQPEQPNYLGMADQGQAPVTPEDNRSWMQRFEDSYNPALSPQARIGVAQGAAGEPNPELFKWDARNSGNEFQQYSATQRQYLNSVGAQDASSWLQQLYKNELQANAPKAPNPYAFVGKDGPDMKAFGESITAYAQGLQQAAGKAAQAVQAEKRKLFEMGEKFGTQRNTSESHEMDVNGRRPGVLPGGVVVLKPVSPAEQERGLKAVNALQDLEAASKTLGFEGAYQAAQAKARADGNVNNDTIIANLIAMGAVPSNQAIYLKQLMAENPGALGSDLYKQLKTYFGEALYDDPAKRKAWEKNAVANVRAQANSNGYDYVPSAEGKAPAKPATPAPANVPPAPENAKAKLVKEHAAKRASKALPLKGRKF